MKKAFTIIELLVAMGLMAVVLAASGAIFHYSVNAQRTASATSEIMRNLRAITDQLNADFEGLCKDGYLILRSEKDTDGNNVDNIYYFSTGDFQSWFNSDIRSNIARIYFGHDRNTYNNGGLPGNLVRDVVLLTPGQSGLPADCYDVSYAECKQDISNNFEDPEIILKTYQPNIDINNNPDDIRKLLCQNVGSLKIEWTYNKNFWADSAKIDWYGIDNLADTNNPVASQANQVQSGNTYEIYWRPDNTKYWPYALKFTFTLYDSKGLIKGGRTFTHIVYLDR